MSNNVLVPPPVADSRQRILDSARGEIERNGILGLRVADVARGADTSITLIYRYFGDRDGLLAQVLGDMYYEFFHPYTLLADHLRKPETTLTIQDLVDAMPLPDNPAAHDRRWMRMQILAAAANNEPLRERIAGITRDYHATIRELIDLSREKIGSHNPLPSKVYGAHSVDVQHDVCLQRHAGRWGGNQPRIQRVHDGLLYGFRDWQRKGLTDRTTSP